MASLSLCPQFETNLMLNRKIIEFLLQLKSAKAHGKTYIKVKPHLVRHLLRKCLLPIATYSTGINPSFTKPFDTHTFYQGGGGSAGPSTLKNRCPHEPEIL